MATYKQAGVDVEAGEKLVDKIKPLVRSTFTPGVLADIGSFGAFFEIDFSRYERPVLVSSVDGVGTKLKVAFQMNRHDTVGQDLVNHCVNDIAVCGAKPLYFLDYFATGRLEPQVAHDVIAGFSIACRENRCSLIGGETAEMPDMYRDGEYDLAGMIVGIVEKDNIVDGSRIQENDVLVGIPSNGLHTNGFSLARHVLFEHHDVTYKPSELSGRSIGEELLKVHRSYLDLIQELLASTVDVKGLVHVTGGGIPGNTSRIIPDGLSIDVDYTAWNRPTIFDFIQKTGSVPEEDMRQAFNLGIGLIIVVGPDDIPVLESYCHNLGELSLEIGRVINK